MKILQLVLFLLLLVRLGPGAWAQTAAVAYTEGGALYLATASGHVIRVVKAKVPIGQIAVSPDARVAVFVPVEKADAYGGSLYILDIASGRVSLLAKPKRGWVYADPDYAPNLPEVAIAVHGSRGDLVEASGPLATVNLKTHKTRVLRATLNVDANGPAFANSPRWSPNAGQILMNFEDGAAVTGSAGRHLHDLSDLFSTHAWSNAIGWLGNGCVVFISGRGPLSAEAGPARVLVLRSRKVLGLAGLLGVPRQSVTHLAMVSPSILIRRSGAHYEVVARDHKWTIPYEPGRSFVTLVGPQGGPPAACGGND